ncbi:hypothetical protein M405DRAFT_776817 [Rhizopogon salebrosus TDB-379]|nr:hypothetical protein M405DRAFT_776817 [Rhizopogon salebrosus TDB-379]
MCSPRLRRKAIGRLILAQSYDTPRFSVFFEVMNSIPSDSDSDSPTSIPWTWPFTAARSTAPNCSDLLTVLLAADAFDEISDIDNLESVERYITHRGLLDDGGRTRKGMVFWFYPTGLYGPYRYLEGGAVVVRHVTLALVMIEPGVDAKEFMNEFKVWIMGHRTGSRMSISPL